MPKSTNQCWNAATEIGATGYLVAERWLGGLNMPAASACMMRDTI
jgi:hypothetical protein